MIHFTDLGLDYTGVITEVAWKGFFLMTETSVKSVLKAATCVHC